MRLREPKLLSLGLLAGLVASPALAQRTTENAVNNADDAFGSNVGLEQTGIYSENDTRGFSPNKAGNARIDGVYYDPVSNMSSRVRGGTAIRVGFAAEAFPFQAPTGIADYRFRPFPEKAGISPAVTFTPYGGSLNEVDLRLPLVEGKIALTGGFATADLHNTDRSYNTSWGAAVRPFFRFGSVELVPFLSMSKYTAVYAHPLVVVRGAALPEQPEGRPRLFQKWAKGTSHNWHYGSTFKAGITDNLSLRAGLFRAEAPKLHNFSEIYTVLDGAGTANHRLVSDPRHDVHSTSGEALLALRLGSGKLTHRLLAGYRGRNRYTETGGSDIRDFGTVAFGTPDPEPEPSFSYGAVNASRVKQGSWMLGYSGRVEGAGSFNLGVQKTRYRAVNRDARSGAKSVTRDSPWLYNASLRADLSPRLSVYVASQRGLEDSGVAPENATNRSAQLPAARSTGYEGGLRWKIHGGQLVASVFQITKPYFTFDGAGAFVQSGQVRHRGAEASLSGHIGKRFNIVAGAVALQPRVTGPAAANGKRPAGAPDLYAKVDMNYRTDLFGGLTPTAALTYTGRRAVGAAPLGGRQLMLPGMAMVDLGLRQQFKVGKVPASFRAVMQNVFDKHAWKVVAPNALIIDERRRFTLALAADF